MSKKNHLNWHDIEMYLKEKVEKRELMQKKDHYINDLIEAKNDLNEYKKDVEVYNVELGLYKERLAKNKDVLEALKLIFPEDKQLLLIVEDLES